MKNNGYYHRLWFAVFACIGVVLGGMAVYPSHSSGGAEPSDAIHGPINVYDFREHVQDGDWSGAIQRAIDSVGQEGGFADGADIYFPPGKYRVDKPIVVGTNSEHWGIRLVGYGATLIASRRLDMHPWEDELRERASSPDYKDREEEIQDDLNLGVPILELRNPGGREGAGYVIEGLTFDREFATKGVGIKITALEVPKSTVFRSIKVFNQHVGIHANRVWQVHFENCIIMRNDIGIWGQNHFNNVTISACTVRRNRQHGIRIGPDRGQTASSGVSITGSIFESNRGYGLLNESGVPITIQASYFEANGNAIALKSGLGSATVTGNFFGPPSPHDRGINRHHNRTHIEIAMASNVQIQNNRYVLREDLSGILLTGRFRQRGNVFDRIPQVAPSANLPDGARVASDDGLHYYSYDDRQQEFIIKPLSRD